MITILASSPTKESTPESPFPALDERNGFICLLEEFWVPDARCLMIAADPDAFDLNDEMTGYYHEAVVRSGLSVSCFDLWDARYYDPVALHSYDVIFLAGGHVPTERAWFEFLHLRDLLCGFDGLVIGTSAGSMNAANLVYAWPERDGESLDPNYELFFPGLGLAECMLLPHYQKVKDARLDGKLYVQEIACGDSYGHRMLAVPDGSFVLAVDGEEIVFGEAYLVENGTMTPFCAEGEERRFC